MDVLEELYAVAWRLSRQAERPLCGHCGRGRLILIDERPDPNFGILGMLQQTFKCDLPECGRLTVV